jgi:hypothetical protein
MSLIVCHGPEKGSDASFRCRCCGDESPSIESFAPGGACWPCAFGGNLDCRTCRHHGVAVDRFSDRRGKLHRMREWQKGKRAVVTACGFRIPKDDIGQAVAARDECRHCWRDGFDG